VSRGDLTLHLSEHHGDCCPGSTVFVWMEGIEEFHREITSKGYGYLRPGIETTSYHTRSVQVIDPFGNRIRFNERLGKAGSRSRPCDISENGPDTGRLDAATTVTRTLPESIAFVAP